MTQLAQTTMRAEIGQMTLDRTLAERTQLNANIVHALNSAALDWGIQCLRYEIRDIHPPGMHCGGGSGDVHRVASGLFK